MFGDGAGNGGWVCCSLVVALALALGMVVGFVVVWWWHWHWRLDILLLCRASLLQFDKGERKKNKKLFTH